MTAKIHNVLITTFAEGDCMAKCSCGWSKQGLLSQSAARGAWNGHIDSKGYTPGTIKYDYPRGKK